MAAQAAVKEQSIPSRMKKLPSILLVDDDAAGNFLNQRLLTRLQIAEQLHTVESGPDALQWLDQVETPPALLLLYSAHAGHERSTVFGSLPTPAASAVTADGGDYADDGDGQSGLAASG